MAKPGELTPVRHNEDSGELYFLTADSVAKNPIGSVKIPRPSDIDDSTQRTQEDIKEDGLRIMTLNTAGLGYGTGYPRSIAKLPPDTYAYRLAAVGVQRQVNLDKLLETIKNYDIITLSS